MVIFLYIQLSKLTFTFWLNHQPSGAPRRGPEGTDCPRSSVRIVVAIDNSLGPALFSAGFRSVRWKFRGRFLEVLSDSLGEACFRSVWKPASPE
jgi:hypothetical protein